MYVVQWCMFSVESVAGADSSADWRCSESSATRSHAEGVFFFCAILLVCFQTVGCSDVIGCNIYSNRIECTVTQCLNYNCYIFLIVIPHLEMRFIVRHVTRFRPMACTHFGMRDNNGNYFPQSLKYYPPPLASGNISNFRGK